MTEIIHRIVAICAWLTACVVVPNEPEETKLEVAYMFQDAILDPLSFGK